VLNVRRAVARFAVIAVGAASVGTGLVGLAGAASTQTGTLTVVGNNHLVNNADYLVTFHTSDMFVIPVSGEPQISAAITGQGGIGSITAVPQQPTGTGATTQTITLSVKSTLANPGLYDVKITQGTTTTPPNPGYFEDWCFGCLSVVGHQPVVSSVSPNSVAEGSIPTPLPTNMSSPGFQNFVITGQNFAAGSSGHYVQCTVADCSSLTGPPTIAIRHAGTTTSDPNIQLLQTCGAASCGGTVPSATQILMRLNVLVGPETAPYVDDVLVTNTDGRFDLCGGCLQVFPHPTIDSIELQPTGDPTIGANASGQTLLIHGHYFRPDDTTVRFIAPTGTTGAGSITSGTPTVSTDGTTVTVPNVNTQGVVTSSGGLGTWHVELDYPTVYHALSNQIALTVEAAPIATDVTYDDSTKTVNSPSVAGPQQVQQPVYGQGARSVRLTIAADGTFVPGSGAAATHTHAVFGVPTGVTVVSEVATSGDPDTVVATLDLAPGIAINSFPFHLVNPDGGASADCNNSQEAEPPAPTPLTDNTCNLTTEAGPTITSVAPASFAPGTSSGSMTITGNNIHTGNDSLGHAIKTHVKITDGTNTFVNADFTPVTASGVTSVVVNGITVPANQVPEDADVILTNGDDKGTTTCTACAHVSNVTINAVFPDRNSGALNDGPTPITIDGDNFASNATFTLTQTGVATIPVTDVTVLSPNTNGSEADGTVDLTGVAPGLYDVNVVNPGNASHPGTGVCPACFYVVAPQPTATAVSPNKLGGGATNVPVTLTGTNIFPGAHLSFSSASVSLVGDPVIAADHTSITQNVSVAANATSNVGTATVTNTDGQQPTTAKAFTVDPAPTVSGISPSSHGAGTSFQMTITGSGFTTSPQPTLSFSDNGVQGTVTNVSNAGDSITATITVGNGVAASGPEAVHVTVVNGDSGQGVSPTDLTINPKPVVNNVQPSALAVGSSQNVVITGTGFQDSATVAAHTGSTGLTIGTPNVVSSTEIDVPVSVDSAAAKGARVLDITNPDAGATTANLSVITVPSAPSNVAAFGGAKSVTVTWGTPADNGGSAITSYTIVLTKQSDQSLTTSFTTPNANTFGHTFTTIGASNSPLQNATTYVATVVATNAAGNSAAAPNGGASATTATVPSAPTAVHVAPGDARATVSWSAPASNGGAAITHYVVTATPGTHQVTTADGSTLHATVTGLVNGTTYSFRVLAQNGAGNSASSAAVSATPKFATTLNIATTKSAVSYGTPITLSGHLMRASGPTPLAGAAVMLFRVPDVGKTQHIATFGTSSTGRWSYTYTPSVNAYYYVRYLGSTANASAISGKVRTAVAAAVHITSPANNSKTSASTPLAIKGSVGPNKAGVRVTLYYVNSSGKLIALASTLLTSSSTFAFSVKLGKGTWHLRVAIGATTNNLSGRSSVLTAYRI